MEWATEFPFSPLPPLRDPPRSLDSSSSGRKRDIPGSTAHFVYLASLPSSVANHIWDTGKEDVGGEGGTRHKGLFFFLVPPS